MDGDGVQQAFCPLLWQANGGSFNANGTPRMRVQGEEPVRGYCTRAYDCIDCPLMQQELSLHPVNSTWWVCPSCMSRLRRRTQGRGLHLRLAGFYAEGPCQNPTCQRVGTEHHVSSLLQLVLGDIRREEPDAL